VLTFVREKVFAAARPAGQEGGLDRDVKLADAVKASLPFVEKSFPDRPLTEARLRMTMGLLFWHLREAEIAAEQFQRARALYTQHRGPDHPDTLRSMMSLAITYSSLGRHADALKLDEETLALRKAKLGPDHPDTLASMFNVGLSHIELKNYATAEVVFLEYQAQVERNTKNLPPEWQTNAIPHLVRLYEAWGKPAEAEKWRTKLPARQEKK